MKNIRSLHVPPPIPDKGFPIYIENQIYNNIEEIFRPHWHEQIELLFIKSGEIEVTCNTEKYRAIPGDLIIINPNDVHHLTSVTKIVDLYCVIFDISLVRSSLSDPSAKEFFIPLSNNQLLFAHHNRFSQEMFNTVKNIESDYNNPNKAKSIRIKSYVYMLLYQLFEDCPFSRLSSSKTEKRNSNIALIQEIIEDLNRSYTLDIYVKELANQYNISYYHLCHIFKDYTDKSIIEYVTLLRLDKAKYYLEHTEKSISEISYLVGYKDSNYFSRIFKKKLNLSPRQYSNV